MKIKDLPKNKNLGGVLFKHPETEEVCEWRSQWQKGVFYVKPGSDVKNCQIYPIQVEKLEDALEWEVVENV